MATTTAPIPHDGTAPAGALTTVFTPPADCANDVEDLWYKTRTCLPLSDRWRLYWEAASFYSPGICPSGMHSVASPPPFFGPPIEPGETAIVCCPTGYTLSGTSATHSCQGPISVSRYSVISVTSTVTRGSAISTSSGLTRDYYNTTTINNIFPIQVRWRESDLPNLETHPLSPGVTPTESSESENGGDSETGSGSSGGGGDGGGGGGLSGGIIAGIVVGVVAFLAILAGVLFILYRRRKRRSQGQDQVPPQSTVQTGYANAPASTASPGAYSSKIAVSDSQSPPIDFVPTGNEAVDDDLRRIAARRSRLRELELLDQEEAQLRQRADLASRYELGSETAELSAGPEKNPTVGAEYGSR